MVLNGKTQTRFSVQADYEVNTLSRVLELFTIRGLTCENLTARKTNDGQQWIELHCCNVGDHGAYVILQKLRQIVPVRTVQIETLVLTA